MMEIRLKIHLGIYQQGQEYVKGRARIVLINYGEGTVINLYFEDDWEAPGEWRIYVLF